MSEATLYIVEDHDVVRESYQMLFDVAGYEVIGTASSAEEALEQLREHTPDIALVDVSLPGMDGIDLVRALRETLPDTRFVVVTGHDDPQYRLASQQAGADRFIRKGRAASVLDTVEELMEA